jgi:hypothetical protein
MAGDASMDALLAQRQRLSARIRDHREERDVLLGIIKNLDEQLVRDECLLDDVDSALGRETQLRLEQSDVRLRGRRLEEVAMRVLADEKGADAEVHYRDWFELLRARGYWIGGKEPLNTFLAQINRSSDVERVGKRSGRYRLVRAA